MPVRHRNCRRRLRETLPDLLDQLRTLGRRELENLVSEGTRAHSWKVTIETVGGKVRFEPRRASRRAIAGTPTTTVAPVPCPVIGITTKRV